MIDFIKGIVVLKSPTFVVMETAGGVGYRINISVNTYSKIEQNKEVSPIRLLTYLQIREDAHLLYGFAEESERSMFQLLISVSGVGAATAQVLLSSMSPDEARAAILGENEAAFNKVKGIGPKTAKRIILDLKDKVQKESGEVGQLALLSNVADNHKMRDEAISALLALGFQRIPVQKVLNKILQENPQINSVEALIKAALRQLS